MDKRLIAGVIIILLIIGTSLYYFSREKFQWTEMKRSNPMFEKYPPCYDICGATRTIQDKLESVNMQQKYHKLLDVYSIVLCQEKYKNSPNVKKMMEQRISDLIELGAERNMVFETQKVMNDYPSENPLVKDFLLLSTNLIEREINALSSDIDNSLFNTIKGLNNVFYQVHYPIVANISFS
jgi:hypothetical protein